MYERLRETVRHGNERRERGIFGILKQPGRGMLRFEGAEIESVGRICKIYEARKQLSKWVVVSGMRSNLKYIPAVAGASFHQIFQSGFLIYFFHLVKIL